MNDIELPPRPEPDICRYVVTVWRDGVECEIDKGPRYTVEQMQAYARAAVEADRAQRVPDGWVLAPVEPTISMCIAGDGARMNVDDATRTPAIYRAMLASTPAPAQQEPGTPMDAHRAAYFMRRFLHEEKMLGPNEQAALHFTIAALESMESAQHQEPPQQERKPKRHSCDDPLCAVCGHHGIKE